MEFKKIYPLREFFYPNSGGYTGISIFVWKTDYAPMDESSLIGRWGSVEGGRELEKSKFVLEARFFVFGSLLGRHLLLMDALQKTQKTEEQIIDQWVPLMDEITKRTDEIKRVDYYGSAHIDQIVDKEIVEKIKKQLPT